MRCQSQKVYITGASAGIGAECARQFAKEGAALLLSARREQRLRELADELTETYGVATHIMPLDIRDAAAVAQTWQQLPEEWRDIDILINNAGVPRGLEFLQNAVDSDWDEMIDTNIKGVLYVTQPVVRRMLERQRGHIINVGSISGYQVYPGAAVYCATKYALRAISEGLKMDVHGTPIRVTLINPGMVAGTEFSVVRFRGNQEKVDAVYRDTVPLTAGDIADAIIYCATRPAHVDVREITIMPTAQTAAQMVYRESSADNKSSGENK